MKFDRDVARMVGFKDISDSKIKGIQAPALGPERRR